MGESPYRWSLAPPLRIAYLDYAAAADGAESKLVARSGQVFGFLRHLSDNLRAKRLSTDVLRPASIHRASSGEVSSCMTSSSPPHCSARVTTTTT
jgi:hypothetical protein